MDQIVQFVDPLRQFAKDSVRLVKRCTKPDKKGNILFSKIKAFIRKIYEAVCPNFILFHSISEFQKIAVATAIGFAIMGFIGFFVKLIHIPINNIIVGS